MITPDTLIDFGKYKDMPISTLTNDKDYISWLHGNIDQPTPIQQYIINTYYIPIQVSDINPNTYNKTTDYVKALTSTYDYDHVVNQDIEWKQFSVYTEEELITIRDLFNTRGDDYAFWGTLVDYYIRRVIWEVRGFVDDMGDVSWINDNTDLFNKNISVFPMRGEVANMLVSVSKNYHILFNKDFDVNKDGVVDICLEHVKAFSCLYSVVQRLFGEHEHILMSQRIDIVNSIKGDIDLVYGGRFIDIKFKSKVNKGDQTQVLVYYCMCRVRHMHEFCDISSVGFLNLANGIYTWTGLNGYDVSWFVDGLYE